MHHDMGISLTLHDGIHRNVVSKIESGVINPSLEILLLLAKHLIG